MQAYLTHWGVRADRVQTRGKMIEAEILATYRECNGDLLIAGAYSHSRWHEKLFGGTTEYLLHKARVPIFTLHT